MQALLYYYCQTLLNRWYYISNEPSSSNTVVPFICQLRTAESESDSASAPSRIAFFFYAYWEGHFVVYSIKSPDIACMHDLCHRYSFCPDAIHFGCYILWGVGFDLVTRHAVGLALSTHAVGSNDGERQALKRCLFLLVLPA